MSVETPKVSDRIIRAWFDTVLNPLIEGLEIEQSLLRDHNLTWRYELGRFASLLPVRAHIRAQAAANFDQFLSLNPELQGPVDQHDHDLEHLNLACLTLQTQLAGSKSLRLAFEAATQFHDGKDYEKFREIFHAEKPADFLKIVSEYIINNIERLPTYYTTADFWNEHRESFLRVLDSEDVRCARNEMQAARDAFSETVAKLTRSLKAHRNTLSLVHGVPIVDAVR